MHRRGLFEPTTTQAIKTVDVKTVDIEQLLIRGLASQAPGSLMSLARSDPLTALLIGQNKQLRDKLSDQHTLEFEDIIAQIKHYRLR